MKNSPNAQSIKKIDPKIRSRSHGILHAVTTWPLSWDTVEYVAPIVCRSYFERFLALQWLKTPFGKNALNKEVRSHFVNFSNLICPKRLQRMEVVLCRRPGFDSNLLSRCSKLIQVPGTSLVQRSLRSPTERNLQWILQTGTGKCK